MVWLGLLIAVAAAVALVALTGAPPEGGRPVGRTHLMAGARVVLLVVGIVIVLVVWTR